MEEIAIGKVVGYSGKIRAIQVTDNELRIGDKIKPKGTITDFEREVESMPGKHENLEKVEAGTDIGNKAKESVREHDTVYVVR